jgi:phage shock protein A
MGLWSRFTNWLSGVFGGAMSDLENSRPDAVYEAAIQARLEKHKELKQAVANIVYLRNKLGDDLKSKQKALDETLVQLPVAVEEGQDDVALVLIQKKDDLTAAIASLQGELAQVEKQAEEAKAGLVQFQGEIEKLRREKDQMLAARANAQARIKVQETLSGLSVDADVVALDNVRTSIKKLEAEADVGAELAGSDLDAKLRSLREKTATSAAKQQLEEMKRQAAARKAASEGAGGAAGGGGKTL